MHALNCAGMESSWPAGWQLLNDRTSNRMQMSELCTHPFHLTVLQVSRDIYFFYRVCDQMCHVNYVAI
jgi:hypothetical protein